MADIKTRIKLRHDTLANWTQQNIVLLAGELAIVDCGDYIKFKVGNGANSFNDLPFADQNMVSTYFVAADVVEAKAVQQGSQAKAVPLGLAAGAFLSANAHYSSVFGYDAQSLPSDTYSFVWNGDDTRTLLDYYGSHGKGSFSINPLSGLSGVYIGSQSLASILSAKQDILVATTQEWKTSADFAPAKGQIVVWSDKSSYVSSWDDSGQVASCEVIVPGVKVGNGNAYNIDLAFIGDDIAFQLIQHAQSSCHLSSGEREAWNHKITVGDINNPNDDGVVDETLVMTRN